MVKTGYLLCALTAIFVLQGTFTSVCAKTSIWQTVYEQGLNQANEANWESAYYSFKSAISDRNVDISTPTRLPSTVGTYVSWRDGAEYTPRFAAAYCGYKLALSAKEDDARALSVLQDSVKLLAELQEAGFNNAYVVNLHILSLKKMGDSAGAQALQEEFTDNQKLVKSKKVDTDVVAQEDLEPLGKLLVSETTKPDNNASGNNSTSGKAKPVKVTGQQAVGYYIPVKTENDNTQEPDKVKKPGDGSVVGQYHEVNPGVIKTEITTNGGEYIIPGANNTSNPAQSGPPKPNPKKYALLIGINEINADSSANNAINDIKVLSNALTKFAGYPANNIASLINPSADELRSNITAFAEQLPDNAIVFLFISGSGVYDMEAQADYILCADALDKTDREGSVSKEDILSPLAESALRVISVWQVSRTIDEGEKPFGTVIPSLPGSFAIWNACSVKEMCYVSKMSNGDDLGVFADVLAKTIESSTGDFIGLDDLSYAVASGVRKSSAGIASSNKVGQTPPKPILVNLISADAAL